MLLSLTRTSGTSFSPEVRESQNLSGLIPHVMENMETQCIRCLRVINSRSTPIDKYLYLSSIKATNTDLFYRLLIDNFEQLMPLVYTPTIGDVCLQYSTLYTRPEAIYIPITQRKNIRNILRNWVYPNPSICVVTDGSRILGLGDLGVNGVGISVRALTALSRCSNTCSANRLLTFLNYRSASLHYIRAQLASILRRHFRLYSTAELRMKTTSKTRYIWG
jgi:malate dehydrogenase (oxaloacetate-decarboxylating)(NADP+)